MTGIHKRVHQAEIKKYEKLTAEEKLELGRLGRVKNETEEVLAKTEAGVKMMEAESLVLRGQVEKADQEKRELEEVILNLMRDQVSTERSASLTDRMVKEVQQVIKEMETNQGETSKPPASMKTILLVRSGLAKHKIFDIRNDVNEFQIL